MLYPGAQITEATGKLMFQFLAIKHGLTKAAITDIIDLVYLHMPAGNALPHFYKSVHCLYNGVSKTSRTQIVHKLCKQCGENISSANGCTHSEHFTFYELLLDSQIEAQFKG